MTSKNLKTLKCLIAKREVLFKRLQTVYDYSKKAHCSEIAKEEFLTSMYTLDNIRLEFSEITEKIVAIEIESSDDAVANYEPWMAFEDLYCRIKGVSDALLKKDSAARNLTSQELFSRKRLPKLELLSFSGEPLQWPMFYENFKNTIHLDNTLSDHERIQYLIGKLSHRALATISGFAPIAENYELIWNTLIEKYEDKRSLGNAYLVQILEFKPFNNASAKNIDFFLDKFCAAVSSLKQLTFDDLSDFMLLHVALTKLDNETARLFETFSRDKKLPTYNDLITFLRAQAKILDRNPTQLPSNSIKPSQIRKNNSNTKVTHTFVTATDSCVCCKQTSHTQLYKCNVFQALPIVDRFNLIKTHNACTNCLSVLHKYSACRSKGVCKHCNNGRHHSLLCKKPIHNVNSTLFSRQVNIPTEVANSLRSDAPISGYGNRTLPSHSHPIVRPAQSGTDGRPLSDGTRRDIVTAASSSPRNSHTLPVAEPAGVSLCNAQPVVSRADNICLLGTACVYVYDSFGNRHIVRCLVDPGSQNNFMTYNLIKKLNIRFNKTSHFVVKGIGGSTNPIKGSASINLYSRINKNICLPINAYILDRITDDLPNAFINTESLPHLSDIPLADDYFGSPGPIDLLLGGALFSEILLSGRVTGPPNTPTAFETIFGHILIGNAPVEQLSNDISLSYHGIVDSVDATIQRFWQIEEIDYQPTLSADDEDNEMIFQTNYSRDIDGRFSVALPFARPPSLLGESYENAKQRFLTLERKLNRSQKLRLEYDGIIQDYLNKGYISPTANDDRSVGYHIPHHVVVRQDKTTSKVRMVMDASSKSSTGLSLNDVLHTGDNLQNDLFAILLEFRLYSVAFSADIKQMYLQIAVNDDHRKYLKFLYRFESSDPLITYQFNRVCFGLRSSPFLAIRVVRQLANDEEEQFPHASRVAICNTYMDDVCFSTPTADCALKLKDELLNLFQAGGFELVKWSSNCSALLDSVTESQRCAHNVDFDEGQPLKVLGLQWSPTSDELKFTVSIENNVCTKRNILSVIARQFDIIGFIAPVILFAKLLIQNLWLAKIGWDETPSREIVHVWNRYISELPILETLSFPRHLGVLKDSKISLVAFSDASEHAYGAVIYMRIENKNASPVIQLVCAKSKVAPLKTISVARLELCAVLLMARLVRRVLNIYERRHAVDKIYCFTDSTVALAWTQSSPHRFKVFVATRISKIQTLLPSEHFHHVAGSENPADCLSRGLMPSLLINHPLWLTGPLWLLHDPCLWPIQNNYAFAECDLPEIKLNAHAAVLNEEPHPLYTLSLRISSWITLLRSVVHVYRFIGLLPHTSSVTSSDLDFAEIKIIKILQLIYFSDDIVNLNANKNCSPALRKLTVFLDKNGLLRVGGRLRYSNLNYEAQHPLLLPRKDHIVELIIAYYHRKNCHAGPQLLMSLLRQKFWILSCRSLVRKIVHSCNICFKAKPKHVFPLMGDLPPSRVQYTKAFTHTAVDYAGPINFIPYRKRGVRSIKCYLCIFVCLVTRAVHIEICTDLSTQLFLAAFKRFLSRRGAISYLYSDNGTAFIGAKNQLNEIYTFLESTDYKNTLASELAQSRIVWKLSPPRSPHFNGHCEIYVKAFKTHMYRVIGKQLLTYEELLTVLVEIEGVINSRPLTLLSSDPSELTALTPAHFIMSNPTQHLPAVDVASENPSLLNRYQLLDAMVQSFAKRWKMEYLHMLQTREKWNVPNNPIKLGTVVVIDTDNTPPLHWPLGVVIQTYPGKDGIIRVASVKTATGVYKRPVVRLCPLPIQ